MSEIQSIKIQYDYSDAMWGPAGTDGYNVPASEANFERMLEADLTKSYPGVEIIIEQGYGRDGYGRFMVDGDTAHPEADNVSEILHRVWSSFDWVVEL